MKLRKCHVCNIYTIEERCPRCDDKTSEAHYKFIKIRSSTQESPQVKTKK